ncbi:MAG: arylsulfotransferase family protein [Paracoccaceae bacterium]
MERTIRLPVWALLLLAMLALLFAAGTAWAVRSTLKGSDRSGLFGEAAVAVAEFPRTAADVVRALREKGTGAYEGRDLRVVLPALGEGFAPPDGADRFGLEGLLLRVGPDAPPAGWRLLSGAFTREGRALNGAVLLAPDLSVAQVWEFTEDDLPVEEKELSYRKLVHGLALLDDGSVVFAFDFGVTLQRLSACGERLWWREGAFHHAVTADPEGGAVWTLLRTDSAAAAAGALTETGVAAGDIAAAEVILQIAAEDGRTLRRFNLREVIRANPGIDPLEIRVLDRPPVGPGRTGANQLNFAGPWLDDPFHINDVDPLPPDLADAFPGFEAGDVALSLRSLNLVLVIDPETLTIRWWRMGAVQRQHDPDWQPSGRITLYNNRMMRDFSEIVSIDPQTFATETLLDGRDHDFYSRVRGKHQVLPTGGLLIASSQQARVLETDAEGRRTLEILNDAPAISGEGHVITDAAWFPPDRFAADTFACP